VNWTLVALSSSRHDPKQAAAALVGDPATIVAAIAISTLSLDDFLNSHILLFCQYHVLDMSIYLTEASEADLPAIARIATSAFHPETDALSRRLFPRHLQPNNIPDGEAAYDWRLARKATSLVSSESHVIVAIDNDGNPEDRIVGFALWDAPSAEGNDSSPSKPIECTALDKVAYEEMKKNVNQDAVDTFGEKGIAGVWRLYSPSLFA
jgi:hypothetical protein